MSHDDGLLEHLIEHYGHDDRAASVEVEARLREQLSEALERAARYEQHYTDVRRERDRLQAVHTRTMAENNSAQANLSRALDLLLRVRSGEPRTWPQLCRMQEEIDAFVAEVRGPR